MRRGTGNGNIAMVMRMKIEMEQQERKRRQMRLKNSAFAERLQRHLVPRSVLAYHLFRRVPDIVASRLVILLSPIFLSQIIL